MIKFTGVVLRNIAIYGIDPRPQQICFCLQAESSSQRCVYKDTTTIQTLVGQTISVQGEETHNDGFNRKELTVLITKEINVNYF